MDGVRAKATSSEPTGQHSKFDLRERTFRFSVNLSSPTTRPLYEIPQSPTAIENLQPPKWSRHPSSTTA
ncbi:hypothetical protein J1614_007110 [Plenodomus biglobosus]|nr:hypothetical protein J1614_007110 [Plenodomus biglobosus]